MKDDDALVREVDEVVQDLNEAQDFAAQADILLRRLARVVEDDPDGYWSPTAKVLEEVHTFLGENEAP